MWEMKKGEYKTDDIEFLNQIKLGESQKKLYTNKRKMYKNKYKDVV